MTSLPKTAVLPRPEPKPIPRHWTPALEQWGKSAYTWRGDDPENLNQDVYKVIVRLDKEGFTTLFQTHKTLPREVAAQYVHDLKLLMQWVQP